jgi:hypothetical protein
MNKQVLKVNLAFIDVTIPKTPVKAMFNIPIKKDYRKKYKNTV